MKKGEKTIKSFKLEEGLHQLNVQGSIKLHVRGDVWVTSVKFDTKIEQEFANGHMLEDKCFGDMYQEVQIAIKKLLDKEQKIRLIDWLVSENKS